MFSGKTEELIRRMKRAEFAKQKVEIFKPALDTRYDGEAVVSHNENTIRSTPVPSSSNIPLLATDVDVVGIDEAQFFDDELPMVCRQLANRGVRVIIAGLDMDFKGEPFGPIPALMAQAEFVTKVHAICLQMWPVTLSESLKVIRWFCLEKKRSMSLYVELVSIGPVVNDEVRLYISGNCRSAGDNIFLHRHY